MHFMIPHTVSLLHGTTAEEDLFRHDFHALVALLSHLVFKNDEQKTTHLSTGAPGTKTGGGISHL